MFHLLERLGCLGHGFALKVFGHIPKVHTVIRDQAFCYDKFIDAKLFCKTLPVTIFLTSCG